MQHRVAVLLTAAVTALAVPAVAAAALTGAEPAPAARADCPDVRTVVVRGTGEKGTLSAIFTDLTPRIEAGAGGRVETSGVPYPATGDWKPSVAAGVSLLAAELTAGVAECPGTRYVLLGYSQGAWVVGDALAGSGALGSTPAIGPEVGRRVAAVVLYGDPRFVAAEPFAAGTHADDVDGLIARDAGALDDYADRTRSWCEADDDICQISGTGDGHQRYGRAYTRAAGDFVLERLGARPAVTPAG